MDSVAKNLTVSNVADWYDKAWSMRDKRVDHYPLMNSPFPTLMIIAAYIYAVKFWGPRLMKNRLPYKLRNFLVFYNFSMVIINIYLHFETWKAGWGWKLSFICEPCDYSMSPQALHTIQIVYFYYITKFVDFFDTFFFILRKKFSHITVLHVFHHSIMPMNSWLVLRFAPGGHGTFPGFLNTFVHAVMYTYYGLSALGPEYQKLLWWKRYVTVIQLIQFVVGLIHMIQPVFVECDYPAIILYWLLPQGFMLLGLFMNFYVRAYLIQKPSTSTKPTKSTIKGHAD